MSTRPRVCTHHVVEQCWTSWLYAKLGLQAPTACMLFCNCRSAFRGLAYKKYQHVPLYLEWAPKDIWEGDPAAAAAAAAKRKAATSQLPQAPAAAAATGTAAEAGVEAEDGEQGSAEQLNSCIYVKNLNFGTTDAAFKKHFDKAVSAAGGTIHAAKVRPLQCLQQQPVAKDWGSFRRRLRPVTRDTR